MLRIGVSMQFEIKKPTLEQEMEMNEMKKEMMEMSLPVTPVDEYFQNKNVEESKGKIINLTGK